MAKEKIEFDVMDTFDPDFGESFEREVDYSVEDEESNKIIVQDTENN